MSTTTTTAKRGVCILQHVTPGEASAISCGRPATHLVFHASWGRAMESCGDVAYRLLGKAGFHVVAWDHAERYPERFPAWLAAYIASGGQHG